MKIKQSVKIIWQYLKPFNKQVVMLTSLAVVGSFIAASIPYIYGSLVDLATEKNSSIIPILAVLAIWLLLSLFEAWLSRIIDFSGGLIASKVANTMYHEAGSHLLEMPLSFHKHKRMGKLMRIINRGSSHMEMIISNVLFYFGPSFLTVIIALIIMAFIEWKLASLLLIILFIYSVVTIWKTKDIIKSQKKMNKVYETAFGDYYDAISNVQTVKSFTREELEKTRIHKHFLGKGQKTYHGFFMSWRILSAWQKTIFSVGFVSIFGVAVLMLRENMITIGQFVMFVGYISLAYAPFGSLAQNYRLLQGGITSIQRYLTVLRKKREPYNTKRITIKNIKGGIAFEDVSFSYDDKKKVLENISFEAKPGELIALVGESGVGKTTIIDLISGYYQPNKGKVLLDGHNIQSITIESLRRNIALVPQEVTLFNDSIKNNIGYGKRNATDGEIIDAAKVGHAHKFILKFPKKYNQIVGERGIKLSTGQKQRVAIARAVLRNPKILILDEATSSLDSATEKHVQTALDKLMKGRTTFVIAHRLSTIHKADKIIVLEKGKIIEIGDHQELIDKGGVYHELNKLQATYIK